MLTKAPTDAGVAARESTPAPPDDAPAPADGPGPRTLEEALGQMTEYQVQLLGLARRHVPALGFMLSVRELAEEARAAQAETRARVGKIEQTLGALAGGLETVLGAVRLLSERAAAATAGEARGDGDGPRAARINREILETNAELKGKLRAKEEQFRAFARTVGECMRQLDESLARAPVADAAELRNLRAVFVAKLGNHDFLPIEPQAGSACDPREHEAGPGASLGGRVVGVLLPGYRWKRAEHDEVLLKAEVKAGGRAGSAPPAFTEGA